MKKTNHTNKAEAAGNECVTVDLVGQGMWAALREQLT